MKTIMLEVYQSIGGDIRLLRDDRSTCLTQHQITQLGLHLPELEEFDYYEYVQAYVHGHSDGMVKPWEGQPIFPDIRASLDIYYYPSLDTDDAIRVTVFVIQPWRAVVVISQGSKDAEIRVINEVAERMLSGVARPDWCTWFYQGQRGVFRLDLSWYGNGSYRVCYSYQLVPSNPEIIRRTIVGGPQ